MLCIRHLDMYINKKGSLCVSPADPVDVAGGGKKNYDENLIQRSKVKGQGKILDLNSFQNFMYTQRAPK